MPIKFGELALVTAIAVTSVAYLFDARSESLAAQNLLMVQPLAIGVVVLCLFLAVKILRPRHADPDPGGVTEGGRARAARRYGEELKVGAMLVLMGAYVFSLERAGMDVASFLFIAAALLLQGERRWFVVLPISGVLALIIVWLFGMLTPFPMNTLIVPG